ncbi:MAG TPA: Ku protein [Longimicrobiales bacterium]|nr:Ku protein [Longimicrobiales bacterium]
MSARAIASSTISFGLVSLPVKLYATGESGHRIRFNLVHEACGTRLKQQYICPKCDVVVPRDDMVKGYEFSKGQYVMFTPEELKVLEEKATESIDIAEFVPAEQVAREYLDRVYYLGPDKGGERAYRLLSRAMTDTGLSALGRYSARGKQYLVLVRPKDGGLVMEQLHYADELRSFSEVPLGDGQVKDEELKLAVQLVQQAASDEFRPENYEDEVRKRVLAQIEQKVQGQEITLEPAEEPKAQIIDLMEALKASLAKGDQGGGDDKEPTRRAERKKAAASSKRRKTRQAS